MLVLIQINDQLIKIIKTLQLSILHDTVQCTRRLKILKNIVKKYHIFSDHSFQRWIKIIDTRPSINRDTYSHVKNILTTLYQGNKSTNEAMDEFLKTTYLGYNNFC